MKSSGFGKAMWSAIISRSLTKNMIYDHSRSWSPKSQKYDLKSIMIMIWSEMIGDHEDLDLALRVPAYTSVIIMHFKSKSNVSSHVYLISTSHRIVRFRRLLHSLFLSWFLVKMLDMKVEFGSLGKHYFFLLKKSFITI